MTTLRRPPASLPSPTWMMPWAISGTTLIGAAWVSVLAAALIEGTLLDVFAVAGGGAAFWLILAAMPAGVAGLVILHIARHRINRSNGWLKGRSLIEASLWAGYPAMVLMTYLIGRGPNIPS